MAEQEYLSVSEALETILANVRPVPAEKVPLLEALHRVSARPILAADDLPPFTNSAMDGFAVRSADIASAGEDRPVNLTVIGDIAAGRTVEVAIGPGQSARIMTGAPLPPGADAVVPVEDTDEPWRDAGRPLPEKVAVSRFVQAGGYVRLAGEDVRAGEEVIASGVVLRPQEIGLLAALGHEQVCVYRAPLVAILATGDELVPVGHMLSPGKIRNSNSLTQAAQVISAGGRPLLLGVAGDTVEAVRAKLREGLGSGADLFVSSAGVSVGAFDVVKQVLSEEGQVHFWRVRMRPGKPLTFGTYQGIPYLGLPGNPVSALVSFERFARPAILKMSGRTRIHRPRLPVRMLQPVASDGRESYVRVEVGRDEEGYWATPSGGQGSHIMGALTKANGLAIIPEGKTRIETGEVIYVLMMDWPESVF